METLILDPKLFGLTLLADRRVLSDYLSETEPDREEEIALLRDLTRQVRFLADSSKVIACSTVTLDMIKEMAISDVNEASRFSDEIYPPQEDGDWDSYLINSIGLSALCRLFDEPAEENEHGWSDDMTEKLRFYNDACNKQARLLRTGIDE